MGEVAAENIMGMDAKYDESTNPTCIYGAGGRLCGPG